MSGQQTLPLFCVLLSGHPGSGKPTLAKQLAPLLAIPLACRDDFKEILFDSLGIKDRAWSGLWGGASYDLLWHFAESHFRSLSSCILESNFTLGKGEEKLRAFSARFHVNFVQVILEASPEILIRRFKNRWESGHRHSGHCDDVNFDEQSRRVSAGVAYQALNLPGTIIRLDTSNFDHVKPVQILEQIQESVRSFHA